MVKTTASPCSFNLARFSTRNRLSYGVATAVGSSRIRIRAFRYGTLAIPTRYLWDSERCIPLSCHPAPLYPHIPANRNPEAKSGGTGFQPVIPAFHRDNLFLISAREFFFYVICVPSDLSVIHSSNVPDPRPTSPSHPVADTCWQVTSPNLKYIMDFCHLTVWGPPDNIVKTIR